MIPLTAVADLPSKAATLDFIARYEAPGGYDQVHAAVPETPPRPLTAMSIREVLAWQKQIRPRAVSTAAGRYQIIHDTLARLAETYGIDPEQRFDPAMQARLGQLLLDECGTEPAGNTRSRTAGREPGQLCPSSADPPRAALLGMGLPAIAPWLHG